MKDKLLAYINENLKESGMLGFKKAKYNVNRAGCLSSAKLEEMESVVDKSCLMMENMKCGSIDDYITSNKDDDKFQKLLFKYIDDKGLKDSDVYKKVHIDRRLFSKIRNEDYHPSKETVILLGLALELNESEFDELITSASYSLPKNNVYDLIIRFCFVEGVYKIKDVNDLLDSYNCKLFTY